MTEWERLQNGLIYNDFDAELFERRVAAKKLFRAYNKTDDDETELRTQLMQQIFKRVGKNIAIEDDVYINFGCVILDCAEVTIGSHTLLGPNIGLYAANHATDATERINGGCYGKPIHIGKNVWLGGDVKVLPGVSIGDNTIIGTGSIVTKNIPANVIAVGTPCKVIREITEKDKTRYLDRKN